MPKNLEPASLDYMQAITEEEMVLSMGVIAYSEITDRLKEGLLTGDSMSFFMIRLRIEMLFEKWYLAVASGENAKQIAKDIFDYLTVNGFTPKQLEPIPDFHIKFKLFGPWGDVVPLPCLIASSRDIITANESSFFDI